MKETDEKKKRQEHSQTYDWDEEKDKKIRK